MAGTVPNGQTHLIFQVYVCVDTVLFRYNTVKNIAHGNNQRARPHALKPRIKMKKQAGQATPVFTFPLTATTCDSRLYIGNLRDILQAIRGMICFFPTATQWQTCAVLIAAVAFAAR